MDYESRMQHDGAAVVITVAREGQALFDTEQEVA